ncbi:aspartate kinase [Gilvibacter sp.]|uniref:aspartate kinase n=1 Tax=Gilvibacter sp. TaxID=2729997 RepID=UPI003F4A4A43
MRIFKFGGASVKDATGVRNLKRVLENTGSNELVVVVSAMGKTTNALEAVVSAYFKKDGSAKAAIEFSKQYHSEILNELFPNKSHGIHQTIKDFFGALEDFLAHNRSETHAFVYDQVVSFGELISTTIVSTFLNENGHKNTWLDVRSCIKTDSNYRDPRVDWQMTQELIKKSVDRKGLTITQGFLGSEVNNNFTTTLGREGSDYTAAIFGYCLDAESVTIWKDVPGVLNADPRHFSKTQLLNHISYREAIELAFYGASVIHPKTLQPLQRKEIPLYVRSFIKPKDPGTCVTKGKALDPMVSCFILKKDQVLISLSSLDFSFMMEDHIGEVFKLLHQYKMKVELIQNSAISFSVVVDNKFKRLPELLTQLKQQFSVTHYEGVTLYTVRHAKPEEIKALVKGQQVLLKQEAQETVQVVIGQS